MLDTHSGGKVQTAAAVPPEFVNGRLPRFESFRAFEAHLRGNHTSTHHCRQPFDRSEMDLSRVSVGCPFMSKASAPLFARRYEIEPGTSSTSSSPASLSRVRNSNQNATICHAGIG